jgi:hypothetical protein
MKAPLLASLTVMLATGTAAWACPQPPPMRQQLVLVTAPTTTITADGAVLVRLEMTADYYGGRAADDDAGPGGAAALTVRVKRGATLTPAIEYLPDGLQRWRFPTKVERDLEVVGADGAVVATLHQITGGASPLPAPKVKKLTSTAKSDARAVPYGVVPSHLELDLGAAAPARATMLIAELVDGHVAWFSLTPPASTARRLVRDTYGGKGCGGAPSPVLAGTRLRFAWIDANGRRSAWTKPLTVAYAPAPAAAP